MTTITDLPMELLHQIVQHVNKRDRYHCALVNKQFHSATNPLIWHTLYIYTAAKFLNITTLIAESRHSLGQHVRYVNFGDRNLTDAEFLDFTQRTCRLEGLLLESTPHITDASFEHLPHNFLRLTYLCLGNVPITRRSVLAFGQYCPLLDQAYFHDCNNLECDVFSAFATWPSLVDLGISDCNLSGMNNARVAEETALDLVGIHRLTRLFIQQLPIDFTRFITTTHDRTGNLAWPNLTQLFINTSITITDTQIIDFIRTHPQLEELDLCGGTLTDATLDAIIKYLPNITVVGVDGNPEITCDGVRRMVKNCPHLLSVSCGGCSVLVDDFPEQKYPIIEDDDDEGRLLLSWLDGDAPHIIRQQQQ